MAGRVLLFDSLQSDLADPPRRIDPLSGGVKLSGHDGWSVHWRRLRGGLSDGIDVIDLCSGAVTVSLLPTRGMGIWKAARGPHVAAWESPVRQPVHPRHVELGARNGLGWLDGFNELLCRCGLAFNGPPGNDAGARSPIESQLTLHGRIANLPAQRVEVHLDPAGPGRIAVTGVVDECTLFGPQLRLTSTLSVDAGGTTIHVEDRIENLGATETELELLYHINVGPPFLDAGARVLAPAAEVAPRDPRAAEGIDEFDRYLGPTPGYAEQAYFYRLHSAADGRTAVLLHNAAAKLGFSVACSVRELPCFTLWKCTQPLADGYVTGLEPGVNFPNFKAFEREQGRVHRLPPQQAYTASLALDLLTSAEEVAACSGRIAAIQAGRRPTVHRRPTAGFSPLA